MYIKGSALLNVSNLCCVYSKWKYLYIIICRWVCVFVKCFGINYRACYWEWIIFFFPFFIHSKHFSSIFVVVFCLYGSCLYLNMNYVSCSFLLLIVAIAVAFDIIFSITFWKFQNSLNKWEEWIKWLLLLLYSG